MQKDAAQAPQAHDHRHVGVIGQRARDHHRPALQQREPCLHDAEGPGPERVGQCLDELPVGQRHEAADGEATQAGQDRHDDRRGVEEGWDKGNRGRDRQRPHQPVFVFGPARRLMISAPRIDPSGTAAMIMPCARPRSGTSAMRNAQAAARASGTIANRDPQNTRRTGARSAGVAKTSRKPSTVSWSRCDPPGWRGGASQPHPEADQQRGGAERRRVDQQGEAGVGGREGRTGEVPATWTGWLVAVIRPRPTT